MRSRFLVAVAAFGLFPALPAAAKIPPAAVSERVVKLDGLPVVELVAVLMRDVLRAEYVVTPDVAMDRRPASLSLRVGRGDDDARVARALADLGLDIQRRGSIFVISKPQAVRASMVAAGSSAYREKPVKVEALEVVVYTPQYRDVGALAGLLASVIPSLKISNRNADPVTGAGTAVGEAPDALVFAGTLADRRAALMLLAQVDLPRPQLSIRATVYEVAVGTMKRSAFDIAAQLLGSVSITAGSGSTGLPGEAVARLAIGGFSAALSALSSDNRFKVVSSPHVLARSGTESVLVSGSQVPILGAVSVPAQGQQSFQSIEYRDSGVTLRVKPSVYERSIDLDITQELSSFVRTTNGVNGSPTLNKRSLSNHLTTKAGEIFLLGGLVTERVSRAREGLFGGLIGSRSSENEKTEILMLIQVDAAGAEPPARSEARTDGEAQGVTL